MKKHISTILLALVILSQPTAVFAALPAGFETQTIATGLTQPTTVTFTQDGRIFVAQKNGVIRVWKNGALLPTPLVTLTDVNTYGDRGLIGMAVDPNFAVNHYLYVLYTYENTPGANFAGSKTGRIVRLTVNGDTADESSKVVLVGTEPGSLAQPSCENFTMGRDCIPSDSPSHSVGGLRFGPDGKLYASLGEGADFDYADPRAMRAQNLDSLGGKILRINTDGTGPSDNPFYNGSSTANRSKVWAYGFRNSFRFNFQPGTGVLVAGDVGWSTWEEVNKVVKGQNYGWPCNEGAAPTVGFSCTAVGAVPPFYYYAHDVNGAGSVTVGAFPTAYPAEYNNSIFIGDYAQNWIKRITLDGAGAFTGITDFMAAADGTKGPVDVITGPDGNIYWVGIYDGSIRRILYTTGNRQPIGQIAATPTSGVTPLPVVFSSAGSSDPDGNPLTYLWNFGDGATATSSNPSHTYTTNGNYIASLTVFDGQGGQNTVSINIAAGNQAPVATITAPINGSLYKAGDTIQLTSTATDPEDGVLPNSAFQWDIILHHNTHVHYFQTLTGKNPTFPAIDHQGASDVYTEARLTVTDSGGLTSVKSVNIYQNNNIPAGGNMILNPSLETPTLASANFPEHWGEAGYGLNTAIYTYPIAGQDGADAARVAITAYTDGDAKWGFDPVSIQELSTYNFSSYYKSDITTGVVAQFLKGDGTYAYLDLGDAPAAAAWTKMTRTIVAPAGARTLSVFQTLNEVGTLDIDNFSLIAATSTGGTPTDTVAPLVAVSSPVTGNTVSGTTTLVVTASDNVGVASVKLLVDGATVSTMNAAPYTYAWNSKSVANGSHTITAVAKDAAGNTATSTGAVITVLNQTQTGGGTGTNLIPNPSLEIAGAATGTVQSWGKGKYGTNGAVFVYPAPAFDGAKGIKIQMPTYTSGDAKWYVNEVPVTPGTTYNFSHYYQADVATILQVRYTSTANVLSYKTLANLPAAGAWTKTNYTFVPPAGTKSVTVFHIINKVGNLTTDLYNINTGATSTPADTTPPTVSISTPGSGTTVSGVVAVRAQAADASGIAGVQFYVDNAKKGTEITSSPYDLLLDTTVLSNTNHTVFVVARDAAGNYATSSTSVLRVNNATPDTTNPVVTWVSPLASLTVTGTVNMSVTATDNIGVTSVDFNLDSTYLGTVTTAPYTLSLNTALATNGNHSLTATAHDAAGNVGTQSILVTVFNNGGGGTGTTTGPNLIVNGNFETAAGALPQAWNQGGWGTNNRAFTYPTVGHDGAKAASLAITSYTSGDAKWYPNKFDVTPGTQYAFSGWYKTSTILDVIGEYTMTDGTLLYVGIQKENPATTTWTKISSNFTPPTGAKSMTLYPLISAVGTLDIDDFAVNAVGSTTINTDTRAPLVAITSPANNATVSGTVNVTASSTDNVAVTKLWFAVDGNVVSGIYTTAPYTYALNTASLTNGAHILKATAEDAVGNNNIGTSTIIVNNSATSTPDTTKPTVSITAPANGSTATGVINITATAADNVGVTGVQFAVDGTNISGQVATAPYSISWNSSLVTNGAHILSATAFDAAGNNNSATTSISVNNTVVASSTNMIENPSMETAGAGGTPLQWFKGGWGTNNAVLSYPVAGQDGASAAQIQITSYTDGDAKWFFNPKTIIPGNDYVYTNYYKSDATSIVTIRYTLADGTFTYVDIATLAPSATWKQFSTHILPPAGTVALTVFHSLRSIGTLTTDNYSLSLASAVSGGNSFNAGMVSLTFDDGWMSHLNTVVPILSTAGLKGSFEIISAETLDALPYNRILNPSVETLDVVTGNPVDWFRGNWGTNNTTFTYPVAGTDGASAVQVQMTSYTDGDAKWYFKDTAVVDGAKYSYSEYYKSDVPTTITARYNMGSSTYNYVVLATVPASPTWTRYTTQFTMPANVESFTVFHALGSVGTLTVDAAEFAKVQIYVSPAQVVQMQNAGNEIGAHTRRHPSLPTLTQAQMDDEILGSRNDLIGMGVTPVNMLVYPYGDYNAQVIATAQAAGFTGARSVDRGYNDKATDKFKLKIQQVDATTTPDMVKSWVDTAVQNKTWLILMFHQVDNAGDALGTTPANFQAMVDYLKNNSVPVVTMAQGISQMNP